MYEDVLAAANFKQVAQSHQVPRDDLHRVLMFLAEIEHPVPERRRRNRYSSAMSVLALPLGRNFRVTGPARELTTLNISSTGASLIDAELCNAAYIAVDFSYAGLGYVQVVLEVLRVRPLLNAYEVAGHWRCRINPFNFAIETPQSDSSGGEEQAG